jgi:hypothetical protein
MDVLRLPRYLLIPHGCLVGKTTDRNKAGTRCFTAQKSGSKDSGLGRFCVWQRSGLMVVCNLFLD